MSEALSCLSILCFFAVLFMLLLQFVFRERTFEVLAAFKENVFPAEPGKRMITPSKERFDEGNLDEVQRQYLESGNYDFRRK